LKDHPLALTPRLTPRQLVSSGNFFGGLSVGSKLSLGFGLVLLCTIIVGVAAWYALHASQASTLKLLALDQMQSHLMQARIAEKGFDPLLAPELAKEVDAAVSAINDEMRSAAAGSSFDESLEQATSEYREAFRTYAAARQQSIDARLRMQSLAESTSQRFSGVFMDQMDAVTTQQIDGEIPQSSIMQMLEDSVVLQQRLSNLRDSEMRFSLDSQKPYHDDWVNRVSELGTALGSLAVRLDGDRRQGLDEATAALDEYRRAFLLFSASVSSS
jgi:methyl-accepting chemotaxis protein